MAALLKSWSSSTQNNCLNGIKEEVRNEPLFYMLHVNKYTLLLCLFPAVVLTLWT